MVCSVARWWWCWVSCYHNGLCDERKQIKAYSNRGRFRRSGSMEIVWMCALRGSSCMRDALIRFADIGVYITLLKLICFSWRFLYCGTRDTFCTKNYILIIGKQISRICYIFEMGLSFRKRKISYYFFSKCIVIDLFVTPLATPGMTSTKVKRRTKWEQQLIT